MSSPRWRSETTSRLGSLTLGTCQAARWTTVGARRFRTRNRPRRLGRSVWIALGKTQPQRHRTDRRLVALALRARIHHRCDVDVLDAIGGLSRAVGPAGMQVHHREACGKLLAQAEAGVERRRSAAARNHEQK